MRKKCLAPRTTGCETLMQMIRAHLLFEKNEHGQKINKTHTHF